jgi:2'-5' RNA ligase
MTTQITQQIQKKQRKTLYWCIELDAEIIKNHDLIKKSLEENSEELTPLKQMHTTLLYVGRKDDERENVFEEHKQKLCNVTISGHGVSTDAIALKVSKLEFAPNNELNNIINITDKVPTFAVVQHVTVALNNKKGVKAMDSIKAFEEGVFIPYDNEFVVTGKIKQCFY